MFEKLTLLTLTQYVFLVIFLNAISIKSDDATLIPEAEAGVKAWFSNNVKPLASRKGTLNKDLEAAYSSPKTIKVRKDGSGEFKTITDAVKSIPAKNKVRTIVDIGPGVYNERVKIEYEKHFVSFIGPSAKATIVSSGTAAQYGTDDSATLQVESNYFIAKNLIIKNSAPKPNGKKKGEQAVAFRISGDFGAIYNCDFHGFQDTICDDKGHHFYKDCHIEGTVDFIFGSGKSIFLSCQIEVLEADEMTSVITAQARGNAENTGFSFVHCKIAGKETGAFLGRSWQPAPKVVFAYCTIGPCIAPEGWSNNGHPERESQIFFGEYKNTGPGAAVNKRVKFSKQLKEADVKPFLSLAYIDGSKWLLPP